jgi:hypothetical protein
VIFNSIFRPKERESFFSFGLNDLKLDFPSLELVNFLLSGCDNFGDRFNTKKS